MKNIKLLSPLLILVFSLPAYAASSKIGILVFDGVLTSDVTAPIEVFGAATNKSWFSSYEVVLVSVDGKPQITTEEGLTMKTDLGIDDPIDLDVLIVPSAYRMKPLLRNEKLIQYLKDQGEKASWLASNCSGALLLAESGHLDGLKATTWYGGEKQLQKSYPKVDVQFDQNVVVDGRVITSNGGTVSYQAALVLLEKMSSANFANEIADAIQWQRLNNAFGG